MDGSKRGGHADPYAYGYPPPGLAPPYPYPPAVDHSQSTYPPDPRAYPTYPPPSAYPAPHPVEPNPPPRPVPRPDGGFRYDAYHYARADSSSYAPLPPFQSPYSTATPFAGYPVADQTPSSGLPAPSFHQVPDMYASPSHSFSGCPSLHVPPNAPVQLAGASQHGGSTSASQSVLLLHGSLDIWVVEARNLPNMDMFSKSVVDFLGQKLTSGFRGKSGEEGADSITSDPYVSISVAGAVLGRTWVISNSENPVWGQHFCLPVAHHAPEVRFVVKDSDVVGSQLIGTVSIPAAQLCEGEKVEGTYPILGNGGQPCKPGATLKLSIQYIPVGAAAAYHQGVAADGPPHYGGVPGTYFPLRRGGKLTLYQDADVPEGCLPAVKLDQGALFGQERCWRDVFESISQARRLVYIAGWSVYHMVRLIRDGGHGALSCTLGELLKHKAQEGVRVLLFIWDDPSSRSILGYRTVSHRQLCSASSFFCFLRLFTRRIGFSYWKVLHLVDKHRWSNAYHAIKFPGMLGSEGLDNNSKG